MAKTEAPLGSAGLCWALLGSAGPRWAPLGSAGLSWALLGPAGLCWAPLGSAGPPVFRKLAEHVGNKYGTNAQMMGNGKTSPAVTFFNRGQSYLAIP